MAIFRCGPRDSKLDLLSLIIIINMITNYYRRPIFNWAHFLVGSSALILGSNLSICHDERHLKSFSLV